MEEKSIVKIYNGVITNQLFQIDISRCHPKYKPPGFNKYTNTVVVKSGSSSLYIKIPENVEFSKINFHSSAWKLLDFCTMKFTEKNSYQCQKEKLETKIEVPISEYLSLRVSGEISDPIKKKLTKETKEDLFLLSCMSLEGKETRRENELILPKTLICTEAKVQNGVITFCFSEELALYFVNSFPARYPVSLLNLDARNSNLYPLGRKLAIYHGIKNNKKKNTNGKITVRSLLSCCPSLPSYEEGLKDDRHLTRRIYEPFEKTVKELGFGCVLKDANGKVIEHNSIQTMKFAAYKELLVHFSIPGEDD